MTLGVALGDLARRHAAVCLVGASNQRVLGVATGRMQLLATLRRVLDVVLTQHTAACTDARLPKH
jgi:hypothetical protein